MKSRARKLLAAMAITAALSGLNLQLSTALAQGTAFTYQGQLQNGGALASGTYNLTFALFTNNAGGTAVAGPVTNNGVAVSNGLFTVVIDFGSGPWNGVSNWLEIAVETNGAVSFTTLAPRQEVTPTPYAIFANTASNLSGTLSVGQLSGAIIDTQLLHDAVTVNPGPGLSGGGRVLLGNTIVLTNTGVLSVTGNADITATTLNGAVTLGDTATNTDTPNTIVKRDGSGGFFGNYVTIDGALNFPNTASNTTIITAGGSVLNLDTNYNFFAGLDAGPGLGGTYNTGVGDFALNYARGSFDTAVGYFALLGGGGSYDTAIGVEALAGNSGNGNTAVGYVSLSSNTNGAANTAIGSGAMYFNAAGSYNSVLGNNALYSNTLGSNDTAIGYEALYSNTGDTNGNGSANTAEGYQALYSNTLGLGNTANGYQALYSNKGDTSGNGTLNTATGAQALYSNTSGYDNTADGTQALYSNTSGAGNTANGYSALYFNTNGIANTADGFQALLMNGNGQNNTAVGFDALGNSVGGGNTAVGSGAFEAVEDLGIAMNNNTAIGAQTLEYLWKGDNNTALGWHSLYGVTNGTQNIAVGYRAGQNLTNGSSNIEIGNQGSNSDNATIRIGTEGTQTSTYIAGISGVTISPAGAAVFINSAGELGTINSSRRYKEDIQDMGEQSDVILSLRPVAFRYKHDLDPLGTPQFGLIAEEVEKVAPELVLRDDQGKIYSVRYEQINAMLLNEFLKQHCEIQKEHRTVEDQGAEIQQLKEQLSKLQQLEQAKREGAR